MAKIRGYGAAGVCAGLLLVASTGCSVTTPDLPEVAPVPFAVSDYFSPTGYFGDPEGLVVEVDERCAERPEGAWGSCYRVTYTPTGNEGTDPWAGIFWQYPSGNWGSALGREVEGGATRLSFYAALVTTDDSVLASFQAGSAPGIDPTTGEPFPYADAFEIRAGQLLDGVLRKYTIEFPEPNYVNDGQETGRVYGAFGFSLTAPAPGERVTLYLDDIRWE